MRSNLFTRCSRFLLALIATFALATPGLADTDPQPSDQPADAVKVPADVVKVKEAKPTPVAQPVVASEVEFFEAMNSGDLKVKFIAKNDHEARLILTNQTSKPLKVKLPEAFVGVPVLAQFGGGGGGRGGRGGGGLVAAEAEAEAEEDLVVEVEVATKASAEDLVVAVAEAAVVVVVSSAFQPKKSPRSMYLSSASSMASPILRRVTTTRSALSRALLIAQAVVELLKAFGRGELQHNAAQAATWNLNNDMSWQELGAKLTGTRRQFNRSPYFNRFELQAAVAYSKEAMRRGAKAEKEEANSPGYDVEK